MSNQVRVRFAPSPTGFFHIGSARTALFNWLYAHHTGGTFILRIEDTDEQRNTPEALQVLIDGMRWLGLDWNEGPEIGGNYGPYFQSERGHIYKEYIQKLVDSGHAYEKDGAMWFKVSGQTQIIDDQIRGKVERLEEKDFVIVRSNGVPIYHFCVVVDDITMAITHVIRGEDHLSNTSKHLELFKGFGVEPPKFAHIPLILKSNGPGKMSKRDQGALVEEYETRRFLPEAVRNYLCLLGWSPKDDREILPVDEIIKLFDLPGINKNNARFDEQKMAFVNGEYIRKMDLEAFTQFAKPYLEKQGSINSNVSPDQLKEVLQLCQEKIRSIEELPIYTQYFFSNQFNFDPEAEKKVLKKGSPADALSLVKTALETLTDFTEANIEKALQDLANEHNVKPSEYFLPVRFAVSGQAMGPSFYGLLRVLGKKEVCIRIDQFIKNLHNSKN